MYFLQKNVCTQRFYFFRVFLIQCRLHNKFQINKSGVVCLREKAVSKAALFPDWWPFPTITVTAQITVQKVQRERIPSLSDYEFFNRDRYRN
jgi:hypothetical protein